jgi:kinesin family protein 22
MILPNSFAVRTKNVENKPVVNEYDMKPAPKPHFASHLPQPPKLAPAVLTTSGSRPSLVQAGRVSYGGPRASHIGLGQRPSQAGVGPRTSHIGAPRLSSHTGGPRSSLVGPRKSGVGARPSRVPRASGTGGAFQPFVIPSTASGSMDGRERSSVALSDKELDERVSLVFLFLVVWRC